MRRKPWASHCVKKPPPLVYRPESSVFFSGQQLLRMTSSKSRSGASMISSSPSWAAPAAGCSDSAQELGEGRGRGGDLADADRQRRDSEELAELDRPALTPGNINVVYLRNAEAAKIARKVATPMDNTDFNTPWRRVMVQRYTEAALREVAGMDPGRLAPKHEVLRVIG